MSIINIYVTFLKIRRILQIIKIILKHAIANIFRFSKYSIIRRTMVRKHVQATPQRLRLLIEELGPTYIKFGQIIADRQDVISDRFRVELKQLQSNVAPFDTNVAIKLIENECGKLINEVFAELDTTPTASASIGQVYYGVLKSGDKVAVKIQRPHIESKIKLDIYLMRYLARNFAKRYKEMDAINIVGLVDDFAISIVEELDFTKEAANIEMFQRMFECDDTVKIPKVWSSYTTSKMIIMERVDGVTPQSSAQLRSEGLDPSKVVQNGANAIFKMILEYGTFHADPHPGNIFILENNVVSFVDFGIVGMMRQREIDFLADYTIGFAKRDSTLITKALIDMCGDKFFDKTADVEYEIRRMIARNREKEVLDIRNFSSTLSTSIDIIVRYKMKIPAGIFTLLKTLLTLEKMSQRLDSKIDLSSVILPYSKDIIAQRHSTRKIANDIYDAAISYISLARELPRDINEILYKLKEGKIQHDIHLDNDGKLTSTFRQMTLRISYVILLIGLFIGSSILVVLDYKTKFGLHLMYISTILIFLLIIKWLFRRRPKR